MKPQFSSEWPERWNQTCGKWEKKIIPKLKEWIGTPPNKKEKDKFLKDVVTCFCGYCTEFQLPKSSPVYPNKNPCVHCPLFDKYCFVFSHSIFRFLSVFYRIRLELQKPRSNMKKVLRLSKKMLKRIKKDNPLKQNHYEIVDNFIMVFLF